MPFSSLPTAVWDPLAGGSPTSKSGAGSGSGSAKTSGAVRLS